eukprot:1987123-Rhodomonas_salina.1
MSGIAQGCVGMQECVLICAHLCGIVWKCVATLPCVDVAVCGYGDGMSVVVRLCWGLVQWEFGRWECSDVGVPVE